MNYLDIVKYADTLNGARMIECDPDLDLMVIWYGGHSLMHVCQISTCAIVFVWNETIDDAQEAQSSARKYLAAKHKIMGGSED